jgi:hypothetical protein
MLTSLYEFIQVWILQDLGCLPEWAIAAKVAGKSFGGDILKL